MIIKTLNRSEAQNAMKDWILKYPSLPEVEGDYLKIRKDIQEFNQKVRSECPDSIAKKDYYIDAHVAFYCMTICGVYQDLILEQQQMMIFGDTFQ